MSYVVRPFQIQDPPTDLVPFAIPLGRPLDLEIGCGVGWHPVQYTTAHPERDLIAIEHTREKFEKFRSRLVHHPELTNLTAIHADAIRWVSHALPESSIDRCFLLYPNPEPKAANKRWMRMPFMHQLLRTIKHGGELQLATNEPAYAEEAQEWAQHAWNLELIERRELTKGHSPRTHFEKKYLERGETCFDLRWRKP